ncbi:MAG: hypothetical protein JWN56_684 [Sphingobacteriales bacterium]|nr:hypothetical protein [Sphingobacteriales bacterium]
MKNKNQQNPENQGGSTSDRNFKSTKEDLKQRGISNSGGQYANQTDNKQGNVNKGKQNPNVQGKG